MLQPRGNIMAGFSCEGLKWYKKTGNIVRLKHFSWNKDMIAMLRL